MGLSVQADDSALSWQRHPQRCLCFVAEVFETIEYRVVSVVAPRNAVLMPHSKPELLIHAFLNLHHLDSIR